MKTFKKIFLGLFILVTVFALFIVNTKNVKAESLVTHDQLKVEGAGVRTTGKAGIRFVGSVGSFDTTNVTAYGICIAYGETDANDNFVKGETINDKVVLYGEDAALDKDGHYYVVLYNIPEEAYAQNVTARAYVIINGTAIAYGAEVKVRSLASTVINAVDDEQTGDLIDTVYAKIDRISVTANDYNIIKNNKPTKFVNTNVTGKSLVMFEKPSATAEELIFAKGADVFTTLSAANEALVDDDALYLFGGNYTDDITVSHTGIKLYGPNYNVPSTGERNVEAVLSNAITLADQANGFVLNGLKFINTAKIVTATQTDLSKGKKYAIIGFNFENCVVDKGENSTTFISFVTGNRLYSKDLVFKNSSFEGPSLTKAMIYLQDNTNTTIDTCIFNNLNYYGLQVMDSSGLGLNGDFIVKNSRFTNFNSSVIYINYADPYQDITEGGVSTTGIPYQCLITDNYFEKIDSSDSAACIHFNDGHGSGTYSKGFEIKRNKFIDVYSIFKNVKVTGAVFTLNYIYIDSSSSSWVVRGTNKPINCAGNFYTLDGITGLTTPSTYGDDTQLFNSKATNYDTDNYATYEAYLAALEN